VRSSAIAGPLDLGLLRDVWDELPSREQRSRRNHRNIVDETMRGGCESHV